MQLKVHIKVYTSINRAESKSSLDEYSSTRLGVEVLAASIPNTQSGHGGRGGPLDVRKH